MEHDDYKEVYDNVHGYIKIPRLWYEKIVQNPLFHRLQFIKQMGLAHYVYPGATHTRYSHSLGVYHIVDKMIDTQTKLDNSILKEDQQRQLRLAALLHDIGHVPLSHTVEAAMYNDYKASQQAVPSSCPALVNNPSEEAMDIFEDESTTSECLNLTNLHQIPKEAKLHEYLGAQLILNSELKTIIEEIELRSHLITSIFQGIPEELGVDNFIDGAIRANPQHRLFRQLIHGQLDADRIDYLLRDATFTGVRAGLVDLDKLLNAIRFNLDGLYGIDISALRALEQFFFARYSSYSQIPFNKYVQGFEYMAKEVYSYILRRQREDPSFPVKVYSFDTIIRVLENGSLEEWMNFNDSYFYGVCSRVISESKLFPTRIIRFAKKILKGERLEVVHFEQRICSETQWRTFVENQDSLIARWKGKIDILASTCGIDKDDIIIPDPVSCDFYKPEDGHISLWPSNEKSAIPTSLVSSHESIIPGLIGQRLYVWRMFTYDLHIRNELKKIMGVP